MPVDLPDRHHRARGDLVQADEDPVLEERVDGDGKDSDKDDDVADSSSAIEQDK